MKSYAIIASWTTYVHTQLNLMKLHLYNTKQLQSSFGTLTVMFKKLPVVR